MKMISKAVTAAALALVAGASFAGQDLGDGVGSYGLGGQHDASFFVDLLPGTYIIDANLGGSVANDVWLSFGGDTSVHGANDLTEFLSNTDKTSWSLNDYVVTITEPSKLFVNVDLKKLAGNYEGNVTITAAPVPEPASLAMMFAGLGALGFLGRRRNRG